MKRDEIIQFISQLSMSQGFYGRILARINELKRRDYDAYEDIMTKLENQNFRDSIDLVMFFES